MPAGGNARPATGSSVAGGRVLSGRYRLQAAIGHGGVGTVWRARDRQLHRDVAVKELRPALARDRQASERFRREARQAAALSHPSLVTVFDVGEHDGVPYLVMELVDGPSLADVLARSGPLGPEVVATIGHRVASALSVVHGRGLVHRDVKPGNVLLASDGVPRLVDLGAVHVLGEQRDDLTTPGTMLGTIGYVAPEQLEGQPVDPRADVFSLGLVLYECLTGASPYRGATVAEITRSRLADDVPAPSDVRPDVPEVLDRIVQACTRREPGRRPPDAVALADLLSTLVPEQPSVPVQRLLASVHEYPAAPEPDSDEDPDATTIMPSATLSPPKAGPVPSSPPTEVLAPAAAATTVSRAPATVEPAAPEKRPRRGAPPRLVPALLGVAGILGALGLISTMNDGGGGTGGGGASATTPVEVAAASDFDPLGSDGEHGESVELAHDGDSSTRWDTEGYNSRDLGGLKDGVGIWFRVDEAASRVEVALDPQGSDVELYAFPEEPSGDPADWGEPVASETGADQVAADLPEDARVVLVWFTRTAPSDGNRAGVSEIQFLR